MHQLNHSCRVAGFYYCLLSIETMQLMFTLNSDLENSGYGRKSRDFKQIFQNRYKYRIVSPGIFVRYVR